MLQEALDNITTVYSAEECEQITTEQFVDTDEFINEHILGAHMSYVVYETLLERHDQLRHTL